MSAHLRTALEFISRGWPIVPLHEVVDGQCSCGAAQCHNPGKHLRDNKLRVTGSVDRDQVERWFRAWPTANIGIVTGKLSGLWVLNVAPHGEKRLAELEAVHGPMPPTMEVMTPSGGRHIYLRHHPSLQLPAGVFGDEISWMNDGQYAIAPPSSIGDAKYVWRDGRGLGSEFAAIPAWLISIQSELIARKHAEFRRLVDVVSIPPTQAGSSIEEARAVYNLHNMMRTAPWLPLPKVPSPCPICSGMDTFRAHATLDGQWMCTSPDHPPKAGTRRGGMVLGDVLDIDAAQRSVTPKVHLEKHGYWGKVVNLERFKQQRDAADRARAMNSGGSLAIDVAPATQPIPQDNAWGSLCELFRNPVTRKEIIGDASLRMNTMAELPYIDSDLVERKHILDYRERIYQRFPDSSGKGLQFSNEAIDDALFHVAAKIDSFNPIRQYFETLEPWDGTERIRWMVRDIIHADNNEGNRAIIKRWMIGCVRRALFPGCRNEMALTLVSEREGLNKSSFFRAICPDPEFFKAGPEQPPRLWSDTRLELNNKDGWLQIKAKFITEWSDTAALDDRIQGPKVKGFITSPSDNYRSPYDRAARDHMRNGVMVVTSNKVRYKNIFSGDRRFPGLEPKKRINIDLLIKARDQLWAEALAMLRAGEQCFLTDAEETLVWGTQQRFLELDVWFDDVANYVKDRVEKVTVVGILENVFEIESKDATNDHQKRVVDILRILGWRQDGSRTRVNNIQKPVWVPPEEARDPQIEDDSNGADTGLR